ncbi:MAG TPA: CDP-glycerol glycerophosphotransferase family protein [Candidatus Paceibacterota bacterium]
MKTIFIIIPQSSILKNALRSGGFELLMNEGYRLVIFILCKRIPDYIRKEFERENVTLVEMQENDWGTTKLLRLLRHFFHYFIWNGTTVKYFRYSKHYIQKPRIVTFFHVVALRIVSLIVGNIKPLRIFFRWIEYRMFLQKSDEIGHYFDEHKPDLLFSSAVSSTMDTQFLKEAKRRGVTTVTMPKTWDTITKKYLSVMPDYFLVQNTILKEQLIKLQDFPEERIFIIGFPEFDWYARKDIIRPREEHLKKMGLNPDLPVIFFGSQGSWYPYDYQIADLVYGWIKNNELIKQCQLLVRPHFLRFEGYKDPFIKYKNLKHAAYDNTFFSSDAFYDGHDPTNETMIDFVNTLYHSDICVIILSTLALDAVSLNKPVINALFGSLYRKGKDVTPQTASVMHYGWIFETNATSVVRNSAELKDSINQYLKNPRLKDAERKTLRDKVCFGVDGKSSERMVSVIKEILESNA